MADTAAGGCPFSDNVDRRKTAKLAKANIAPDKGARWVKTAAVARSVLRSPQAFQAGAGAEMLNFDNPEHAPVFFLDGIDHHRKRHKTQKFLSPKAVAEQHHRIMRKVSDDLLADFRKTGKAQLEDLSFDLAVEVVGDILGLTNSDRMGRARRILNVLNSTLSQDKTGLNGAWTRVKQTFHTMVFFARDVKPAIEARRLAPRDDAISFYLEEGYPNKAIIIECLTYGTAGMLTTREFIIMAAWYLFEDEALKQRYLDSDEKGQLDVLMEILRLEPVAGMIHRRVKEQLVDDKGDVMPAGELYGIDIREANVDEAMVGECPFKVDPDRARRQRENGRYLSFADGPHNCPGWQVALHETRIFLDRLFRVPGLKMEKEPEISWNSGLNSYELRNALISCDKA